MCKNSDAQQLVSASFDRTLRVWDADTGQLIGDPLTGHTDEHGRTHTWCCASLFLHMAAAFPLRLIRV